MPQTRLRVSRGLPAVCQQAHQRCAHSNRLTALLTALHVCRPGGQRCHDGPVEVLSHDAHINYLLSGGGDGLVRLWEVARIQEAEPPEGSNTVEVKPAVTVAMPGRDGGDGSSSGSSAGVRGLLRLDSRSWLVQSEAGALYKVSQHRSQSSHFCLP